MTKLDFVLFLIFAVERSFPQVSQFLGRGQNFFCGIDLIEENFSLDFSFKNSTKLS